MRAITALFMFLAAVITGWLSSAWAWMMIISAAHSIWFYSMPTIGYADSLKLAAVIPIILAVAAIPNLLIRLAVASTK
jgi:hypothetical protein